MKTKIIFFRIVLSYIIFLLCSVSSYTQVWEVAGEISADSTWTGDTIKVTGDVTVVDNVILTIKPGTYIKFMGHYKLDMHGTLLAVGTETDSIRFSVSDTAGFHEYGSANGGWNGIIFNNSGDMGGANGAMNDNDTSKIQYCQFEFAKGLIYNFVGSGGAVRLDNFDRLVISNSKFINNSTMFCGAAIYCYRGSGILITENFFHKNIARRGGAVSPIDSEPWILKNTFTHNTCLPEGSARGGAIFVETRKPRIEDNIIQYNSAREGGGICLFVSGAYVIGNNISHNYTWEGGSGGGIYFLAGSSGEAINNIINNNKAEYGGGIHCLASSPTLINNLFANDTATFEGGAITMNQANPTFLNNTIVNSYAGSYGGGLDCVASNPLVINTIFWGNSAGDDGDQIMIWEAYSVPEFYNCNIAGGKDEIGGFLAWRPFENNISENSGFLNPASDWHIANNSPCINAGMPDLSGYNMPGNDLDNNTRVRHNIIDIGAYEVHIETITATSPVNSNTTWIADTVHIESDVVVNDDVTLTIVPGTWVNFKGHNYLKVMGTLIAEGQEDNMIVFTVDDTIGFSNRDTTLGTWNSIVFDNSGTGANGSMWDNDTSVLSWCRLEYSMTDYISDWPSGGAIAILYLDQLIIENCEISNNIAPSDGGGIYAKKTKAVIRNNVISNNQALNDGGGIYTLFSDAKLINNTISFNETGNGGGGIHVSSGNPLIKGNKITNNRAEDSGGGMLSNNGSPLIIGNYISNNVVWPGVGGGGIAIRERAASIVNNVIVNNYAATGGGVLYICFDTPLLLNNTIANNRASYSGGGMSLHGAKPYCYNNIFWGNRAHTGPQVSLNTFLSAPHIFHCNVEGGLEDISVHFHGGEFDGEYMDNIDTLPYFRDASAGDGNLIDGTLSDWRLSPVSPCINSGITDITGVDFPSIDMEGNDRIFWEEIDMGAYENHYGKPVITKQPLNKVVCSGDSVFIMVESADTSLIQWQKDGKNIPDAILPELTFDPVEVNDDGNYQAIITNSFGSVASAPVYMVARSGPEIILQPENIWAIEGQKNIIATEGSGTPPLQYRWYKNGELIPEKRYPELWIPDSDATDEGEYHAEITNSCGTVSTDHVQLYMAPQLCMVTVDNEDGTEKNLVVWEKTSSAPILSYNIYRESHMAGSYTFIGSVPYENLSEFLDEDADPGSQAYWYKITAVDTSGEESPLDACLPHKTIHLLVTVNPESGGIQLDWDNYIGFNYVTYDILNRNITTGDTDFSTAHLMASSTSTWSAPTDLLDVIYYRVTVKREEMCNSDGSKKAGSGPYSHSLSNIEDNRLQVTSTDRDAHDLKSVYPNPFSHSTTICFDNPGQNSYSLIIYDLSGKVYRIVENITSSEYELKKGDLKAGIYFVELRGHRIYRDKLVIE